MASSYKDSSLKVLSLNSNPKLAQDIAAHIGTTLGKCTVSKFSDGEVQINIEESVRGCDVYVIQSTCAPVNQHIMELLIMIDALKRASAKSINIVMPYYGYARQDRKARSREPIAAKLVADLIETAGANRVTFSTDAMEAFYHYDWPGNVRELYNVISYCVCLNTTSIGRESLPLFFKGNQKFDATENTEQDLGINEIIRTIEKHGFLSESISLLQIYQKGKKQNESYGRRRIKQLLSDEQYSLTDQQLRLRIEVLNKTGLLNVRKGRAGTTISAKGEQFLDVYQNELRVQ